MKFILLFSFLFPIKSFADWSLIHQDDADHYMDYALMSKSGHKARVWYLQNYAEPQTIKNLPKANVALVEKDFGKSRNEIIKILYSIPSSSNDPYVSSLNTYNGAFETKEIEILFNSLSASVMLNVFLTFLEKRSISINTNDF